MMPKPGTGCGPMRRSGGDGAAGCNSGAERARATTSADSSRTDSTEAALTRESEARERETEAGSPNSRETAVSSWPR